MHLNFRNNCQDQKKKKKEKKKEKEKTKDKKGKGKRKNRQNEGKRKQEDTREKWKLASNPRECVRAYLVYIHSWIVSRPISRE